MPQCDKKQVPCQRSTNISHHCTEFSCHTDLAPRTCAHLTYKMVAAGRWLGLTGLPVCMLANYVKVSLLKIFGGCIPGSRGLHVGHPGFVVCITTYFSSAELTVNCSWSTGEASASSRSSTFNFPVARLKYCRLSDSMSHTNSFESGKKFDYTKSQNTLNRINFISWAKPGRLTSAILIEPSTRCLNLKVGIVINCTPSSLKRRTQKLDYHYKELCMITT